MINQREYYVFPSAVEAVAVKSGVRSNSSLWEARRKLATVLMLCFR